MTKTLIVVVAARITEWVEKGEVSPGYFNPDSRFEQIVVVSLVQDAAGQDVLRYLCGGAECLFVPLNFLSVSGLLRSAGFNAYLTGFYIKKWVAPKLPTNREFVVRSYGDTFSGKFAAILASFLRCRSVASIHTTFTHLPSQEVQTPKSKIIRILEGWSREYAHRHIDALAPVYSPITASISVSYHDKTYIVPNAVDVKKSDRKTDFSRSGDLKIICVGRLVPGKSLLPILEGLLKLDQWHLTIVGSGPCEGEIRTWVMKHGKETNVTFIASMRNKELIASLKDFDLFVAHTSYAEIPKTVIEAGLIGLPIILNQPVATASREYVDAPIFWANANADGYYNAFKDFWACREKWQGIGHSTRKHFERWFEPVFAGKMMADLLSQSENDCLRPWNEE
ncbi:glycosyltransferase [Thalassospira sp. GO-4]|uniref:glycosyltransferase family 4 protein n=1 Tax=Thalassospira sp. GO-4 TaxID=2946605 RepID=UPI002024F7FE|nr:glycosyltransferase [Thalassospira sp. GO-4]URK17055.1 glycosyltransferase [Thalassospira sp. GO-4]